MEMREKKLQSDAGGLGGLRNAANKLERNGGLWEVLLTEVQQAQDRTEENSERASSKFVRLALTDQTLDVEALR